jgi:hypothetical protein
MKNRQITIPRMESGKLASVTVSQEELLESFKRSVDHMPELIATMKRMDNEGWQMLLTDLQAYFESKPELAKLVREVVVDGKPGISISEPNWVNVVVLAGGTAVGCAFLAGYMAGTACFKVGWCDFVS